MRGHLSSAQTRKCWPEPGHCDIPSFVLTNSSHFSALCQDSCSSRHFSGNPLKDFFCLLQHPLIGNDSRGLKGHTGAAVGGQTVGFLEVPSQRPSSLMTPGHVRHWKLRIRVQNVVPHSKLTHFKPGSKPVDQAIQDMIIGLQREAKVWLFPHLIRAKHLGTQT